MTTRNGNGVYSFACSHFSFEEPDMTAVVNVVISFTHYFFEEPEMTAVRSQWV